MAQRTFAKMEKSRWWKLTFVVRRSFSSSLSWRRKTKRENLEKENLQKKVFLTGIRQIVCRTSQILKGKRIFLISNCSVAKTEFFSVFSLNLNRNNLLIELKKTTIKTRPERNKVVTHTKVRRWWTDVKYHECWSFHRKSSKTKRIGRENEKKNDEPIRHKSSDSNCSLLNTKSFWKRKKTTKFRRKFSKKILPVELPNQRNLSLIEFDV